MAKKQQEVFVRLEHMLRKLHASLSDATPAAPFGTEPFAMFSKHGRGISLSGEEAITHWQILEELSEQVPAEEQGRSGITEAVQDAILGVVYGTDLESDVKSALASVRKGLNRPLKQWTVLIPVRGLNPKRLRSRVGQVTFVRVHKSRLADFRRRSGLSGKLLKVMMPTELPDWTFGQVTVKAADPEAAQIAAVRRVRQSVAVLNFYAAFLAHGRPFAYLPGERHSTRTVRFYYPEDGRRLVTMPVDRTEPMGLVNCGSVMRKARRFGFGVVDSLLQASSPNPVQRRLLSGFEAAGRGASAASDDSALLSTVTALEAAVLGPDKNGEISFRLRARVSRLLGRTPQTRKEIGKRLDVIYSARSKISHAGSQDVAKHDLATALALTRACLIRLAKTRAVQQFTKNDQLDGWLNELTLR